MANNPIPDEQLAELDRLHETAIPLTFANAAGHIFNAYPALRQRLLDAESRLAEVDRLRAVVNDMGDLMADVRKQRDAATVRAEAAEKEALDYIDYRNQAVISRNAMERRLEAAEAQLAVLRGALEVLLKCNALGVAIPWGKAVSALTEADRLEKESANAEYLGGTNGK